MHKVMIRDENQFITAKNGVILTFFGIKLFNVVLLSLNNVSFWAILFINHYFDVLEPNQRFASLSV